MSGRTWVMLLVVLGINWGGFVAMLIYGIRREAAKAPRTPMSPGVRN